MFNLRFYPIDTINLPFFKKKRKTKKRLLSGERTTTGDYIIIIKSFTFNLSFLLVALCALSSSAGGMIVNLFTFTVFNLRLTITEREDLMEVWGGCWGKKEIILNKHIGIFKGQCTLLNKIAFLLLGIKWKKLLFKISFQFVMACQIIIHFTEIGISMNFSDPIPFSTI